MSHTSVFVSHTVTDGGKVRQIAADIEKTGFEVWFAPQELTGGERLSTISARIEEADIVLVILSQAAVNSDAEAFLALIDESPPS